MLPLLQAFNHLHPGLWGKAPSHQGGPDLLSVHLSSCGAFQTLMLEPQLLLKRKRMDYLPGDKSNSVGDRGHLYILSKFNRNLKDVF